MSHASLCSLSSTLPSFASQVHLSSFSHESRLMGIMFQRTHLRTLPCLCLFCPLYPLALFDDPSAGISHISKLKARRRCNTSRYDAFQPDEHLESNWADAHCSTSLCRLSLFVSVYFLPDASKPVKFTGYCPHLAPAPALCSAHFATAALKTCVRKNAPLVFSMTC